MLSWGHLPTLVSRAGSIPVSVNVTPNGFADAVTAVCQSDGVSTVDNIGVATSKDMFLLPLEVTMPLSTLLVTLEARSSDSSGASSRSASTSVDDRVPASASTAHIPAGSVVNLSHQNDSLRCQLPELAAAIPPCLPMAAEAFGNGPDAVNLWIGNDRSVTSMHKVSR